MPSYQRESPSPTSDLRSLEVPPVGQEEEYYFNLTPSLPPIGGKFAPVATAPVTTGNSDDDVVTTPPPVAPVDPLVARHRAPGTSGVPTLWQEGPLAEAGNPDDVEGTTPPRRMSQHLRLPRTFLLTMLLFHQISHS